MAGLEGTIKTPFGTVQKKTALVLGGGVAVLGLIVWYRQKNLVDTTEDPNASAPINPATGYPFGSAEDAAALAEQASYISPPASGPAPGGSGGYPSNLGYTTNGQWVQAVIEYMVGNDLVEEPSQLSGALGKYITGSYVTDAEVSLINQAIAVQGFPPISGPTGYPPSLNRQTSGPVTPAVGNAAAPRLHHVTTAKTSAILQWNPAANAATYKVYRSPNGLTVKEGIVGTSYTVTGLKPYTTYSFSVAGVNSAGKRSSTTSNVVTVKTKK